MSDASGTLTVSRSAWLELKDELKIVNDGYEFLDEKAILLAAEMLAQRDAYETAREEFLALARAASATLVDAAADQGLGGLQVYPAAEQQAARIDTAQRSCIGLVMLESSFAPDDRVPGTTPVRPAAAVTRCGDAHARLIEAGAALAAMSVNLARLTREYERTSRRVRALENVILPEIRGDLASMEEHLDLVEQEEVIRVRSTSSAAAG